MIDQMIKMSYSLLKKNRKNLSLLFLVLFLILEKNRLGRILSCFIIMVVVVKVIGMKQGSKQEK